ncbi:MAG: hypothetical protein WBA92_15420 [Pseudorhodobacter sp.]
MRKISLALSTAALSLQNAGARAATDGFDTWVSEPFFAPHPALVAVLALVGMGFLLLMAHTPIKFPRKTLWTSAAPFALWPTQRMAYGLLAMIAVSGSLGLA